MLSRSSPLLWTIPVSYRSIYVHVLMDIISNTMRFHPLAESHSSFQPPTRLSQSSLLKVLLYMYTYIYTIIDTCTINTHYNPMYIITSIPVVLHTQQALATPNYILTPGVTLPSTLVPISAPPSTLTEIGDFLLSQGRCKHEVLGDGNCLFSSLSHQLYGTAEHHSQIRSGLVQLIQKNESVYRNYWIEGTTDGRKVSFDEHTQCVKNNGSWGTLLELQASSDYFSVPIYVCAKNPSGIVQWDKKAIPRNHDVIQTSTCTLPQPVFPFTRGHLELAFESHHYDSVVPRKNMLTVLQPPTIVVRHSGTIVVPD